MNENNKNMLPKDSGATREFATGAHRDAATGKGRCDLLPLAQVAAVMDDKVIEALAKFMETKEPEYIKQALINSIDTVPCYESLANMMIEVSMLYEAGAIDGVKNRFQEVWFLTLPQMKPQLLFGAVMQIASSFAVGAIPMQLTGFPSTDYATHTIIAHVQDYGSTRFELGYACAISTVLLVVMLLVNKVVNKVLVDE